MADESALLEGREKLKRQLVVSQNRVLAAVILNKTGRTVQKITRRASAPPFWYSGLVITLLSLIVATSTSIWLNESPTPEMMLIAGWGALMGFAVMLVTRISSQAFLSTLRRHVVDAIESEPDLKHLQGWLIDTFDLKRQFVVALVMAVGLTLAAPIFWGIVRGGFPGVGALVGVFLIWLQGGLGWYFVFPVLFLLIRLRNYRFRLFPSNPSSSEVIDRLSDLLSNLVYAGAVLGALFTVGLIYFDLLSPVISIIFLVLGTWAPLIILFVSSQYALARIIMEAKWKMLNQIQQEIEDLKLPQNMADKETMEAVNRLMDYHDRIRATRNSALDFRAGLNFLNSLLLPLLAFLLANIDQIFAFFS